MMRYSHCDQAVKIGSAPDVEAHMASLEEGQNFCVECAAVFPGKGVLAPEVRQPEVAAARAPVATGSRHLSTMRLRPSGNYSHGTRATLRAQKRTQLP